MNINIFKLFARKAPEGWRERPVMETFDLKWTNRYAFTFKESVNEAIIQALSAEEMGGIIVFSTDVNATIKHTNPIVQWFKRQFQTWKNRVTRKQKVDTAVASMKPQSGENSVGGYSMGNFFTGRYKSAGGELFDERSLAVEVLFVNHRQLVELATLVCGIFNQEAVLVKDNHSGKIFLVDSAPGVHVKAPWRDSKRDADGIIRPKKP